MGKNRRRDFFTKKAFQFAVAGTFVGALALGNLVLGILLYRRLKESLAEVYFTGHITARSPWEILSGPVLQFDLIVTGSVLLVFLVIIVLFSRGVTRDAASFLKVLEGAAELGLSFRGPRFSFRIFRRLARVYGQVTFSLQQRFEVIDNRLARLQSALAIAARWQGNGGEEATAGLDAIVAEAEEIEQTLLALKRRTEE